MKTAIVYVSKHHENTKKLTDAIFYNYDVTLIDAIKTKETDLCGYDVIGFASGIAYGKFYPQLLKFIETNLPKGKKVFFLYTCGTIKKSYTSLVIKLAKERECEVLGEYGCLGHDTFGPFKLIGGIAKGHPNNEEIAGAVKFFGEISEKNK